MTTRAFVNRARQRLAWLFLAAVLALLLIEEHSTAKEQGAAVAEDPFAKLTADFPDIIYERLAEVRQLRSASISAVFDMTARNHESNLDRAVSQMLRGIELLGREEFAKAKIELQAVVDVIPKSSVLYPLVQMYLLEAITPSLKPTEAMSRLKGIVKSSSLAVEWKPEQYELMLSILMTAKSDSLILKTWSEYEAKVRPANRSEKVSLQVMNYMITRLKTPSPEAIDVLESMASYYPFSESARLAMLKLQSFNCRNTNPKVKYYPSQRFLQRLSGNVGLDPGLKILIVEWTKGPIREVSGPSKPFDDLERAGLLTQLKLNNEALELAKKTLDESPPSKDRLVQMRRARALQLIGQINSRMNEWSDAAQTYSRFIDEYKESMDVRFANEGLADALVRMGSHQAAAMIYQNLAPSTSADPTIRWHYFWNLYLAGKHEAALALLNRPGFVPSRDRGIDGGLDYWRGRILEKLGKKDEAEGLFKRVLASNGDSIYGIMVQASMPALREASLPVGYSTPTHNIAEELVTELEGKDAFSAKILEPGFSSAKASPVESQKIDINLVRILQKWGDYRLARRLLRTTPWQKVMDWNAYPEVRDLAFSLGDFGYGLKVASLPTSPFRTVPGDFKGHLEHMAKHNQQWRSMYPLAFERLVRRYTDAAQIDPFLLLSIMRAESVYDQSARSPVGAQGLMQIMPFTAIRIARVMGDQSFDLNSLHIPEVNIGYAAYYLRRLMDYYSGNTVLAVAAYNAGPVAVDRWLTTFGHLEPDEFIESISFKETRRYTKTVLRNLNQYHNIYGEKSIFVAIPKLPSTRSQLEIF
jgi:soluble lytic murein transglycosylase-like protein